MQELIPDCIGNILSYCPLNEIASTSLVNKTWLYGHNSHMWYHHCKHYLGDEITKHSPPLKSRLVKTFRLLFNDNHPHIEHLLQDDQNMNSTIITTPITNNTITTITTTPTTNTITNNNNNNNNNTKKSRRIQKCYNLILKGFVIGRVNKTRQEGFKKLLRTPLQLMYGEGDGRKFNRKQAFKMKWKSIKEFNSTVPKGGDWTHSLREMFIKRVQYDLRLVQKQNPQGAIELEISTCNDMLNGLYLDNYLLNGFYNVFSNRLMNMPTDALECRFMDNIIVDFKFNIQESQYQNFTKFKSFVEFISKYGHEYVNGLKRRVEMDKKKTSELKLHLLEHSHRVVGYHLMEMGGFTLFHSIWQGYEYIFNEFKYKSNDFLLNILSCLDTRDESNESTNKISSRTNDLNSNRVKIANYYTRIHSLDHYLNDLQFIVDCIARQVQVPIIEKFLSKVKDDTTLPLIFRVTTVKFKNTFYLLGIMECLVKYSKVVFNPQLAEPYQDPLIYMTRHLQSAYGTYDNVDRWVNLICNFLEKGSKKHFTDRNGSCFSTIIQQKRFPASIRYILVDYLDDYDD